MKKRLVGRGTQQADHRTRLWKASADGADTSSWVRLFQSLMVRGKKAYSRTSFLHWNLEYCWSCPLRFLMGQE